MLIIHSQKHKGTNTTYPPWQKWELDEQFLKSLSAYCLEHPDTTLDRVLDRVRHGLEIGTELFKIIPENPFPARSLVEGLACLIKLGIVSAEL
jgi:hypothetical protein